MDPIEASVEQYKAERINPYCLTECPTPCCNFSEFALPVTPTQLDLLLSASTDPEDTVERMISLDQLSIGSDDRIQISGRTCPAYDQRTRLCAIYDHLDKPQACNDFPMGFLPYFGVTMDENCPYVRDHGDEIRAELVEQHPEITQMERHFTILVDGKLHIHPPEAHEEFMAEQQRREELAAELDGMVEEAFQF